MFELAWSEMLVIAVVLIVVVGPKDLPKMLRTFGKFAAKMSSMAGDFRKQFDEAMKEADLDDVRKSVNDLRSLNPKDQIRKALSPMEQAAADVRSGVDSVMRPKTPVPSEPASTAATAAEPLKTGAAAEPNGTASEPSKPVPAATESAPPVTPLAPAAPLAAASAVGAAPAASEPANKVRAPRATKSDIAAGKPAAAVKARSATPKATAKAAPATKASLNGASVEKPARSRKPKETGTAT